MTLLETPRRTTYETTTTVLVEDETIGWGTATVPAHTPAWPAKRSRRVVPGRNSSSQLIENFIWSMGLADEMLGPPDTITSAQVPPVPNQPTAAQEPLTKARKPVWERILERTAAIPDEEWDKLPADLAEQHDHYLYGTPKRPTA